MMPGWMMGGSGWGLGYGLFGGLMMLLFWILIIAGIVLIVRWFLGQEDQQGSRAEEAPLDILKKRYASGETDKEEFEAMKGVDVNLRPRFNRSAFARSRLQLSGALFS